MKNKAKIFFFACGIVALATALLCKKSVVRAEDVTDQVNDEGFYDYDDPDYYLDDYDLEDIDNNDDEEVSNSPTFEEGDSSDPSASDEEEPSSPPEQETSYDPSDLAIIESRLEDNNNLLKCVMYSIWACTGLSLGTKLLRSLFDE